MTAGEFKEFVKTMREYGVLRFKMGNIEFNMGDLSKKDSSPTSQSLRKDVLDDASPDIKHKVENLSSLLKLDDMELVDQLFPDMDRHNQEVS